MRYSTVAAAAAIFFGVAIAVPQKVVTEIEIVTITSCAPEVTDCPSRPHSTPVCPGHPSCPKPETETTTLEPVAETTPCPEKPSFSESVSFPNGTTTLMPTLCAGGPNCPPKETTTRLVEPTTYVIVPTGSGSPIPPANTSTPVVPTSPPEFTGAAVQMGASFAAVLGAAALAVFV